MFSAENLAQSRTEQVDKPRQPRQPRQLRAHALSAFAANSFEQASSDGTTKSQRPPMGPRSKLPRIGLVAICDNFYEFEWAAQKAARSCRSKTSGHPATEDAFVAAQVGPAPFFIQVVVEPSQPFCIGLTCLLCSGGAAQFARRI